MLPGVVLFDVPGVDTGDVTTPEPVLPVVLGAVTGLSAENYQPKITGRSDASCKKNLFCFLSSLVSLRHLHGLNYYNKFQNIHAEILKKISPSTSFF